MPERRGSGREAQVGHLIRIYEQWESYLTKKLPMGCVLIIRQRFGGIKNNFYYNLTPQTIHKKMREA